MDASTFFERVAELRREGRPFAVATVVARRPPVSAHLGDRAIVLADGRMEGFVGGACSREIVRKQALDVLRTREARVVSIRPDAASASEPSADRVIVPMTCASEGAVDVYVEPMVRPRSLVVVGTTPVAAALTRLARAMRWDVVRVVDGHELRDIESEAGAASASLDRLDDVLTDAMAHGTDCAAVVASQGHYDEPALEAILKRGVAYVALVASRRRGAGVLDFLAASQVPGVDRVRNPAGLDLGGTSAEEVALSILAEVVQLARAGRTGLRTTETPLAETANTPTVTTAPDPVCHMVVDIATARHTAEVDGHTYYFCCPNCRARFVKDPHRYLTPAT